MESNLTQEFVEFGSESSEGLGEGGIGQLRGGDSNDMS